MKEMAADNPTARMIELFARLRKEMNGAVAQSMRERGERYPMNYGVSVPTIAAVARDYAPDHALALLLYRQQVRELKLAAAYVDDPKAVTADQMREWGADFRQIELAEQTVHALFGHVDAVTAAPVAAEWVGAREACLRYGGMLLAAALLRPERDADDDWCAVMADRVWGAVTEPVDEDSLRSAQVRAAACVLVAVARRNPEARKRLAARLHAMEGAAQGATADLVQETAWRLDYL